MYFSPRIRYVLLIKKEKKTDIRYPATLDIQYPAFRLAWYPAGRMSDKINKQSFAFLKFPVHGLKCHQLGRIDRHFCE